MARTMFLEAWYCWPAILGWPTARPGHQQPGRQLECCRRMHQDDQQLREFGTAWAGSRGKGMRCCCALIVGTGHYQVWSRLAGLKPAPAVLATTNQT